MTINEELSESLIIDFYISGAECGGRSLLVLESCLDHPELVRRAKSVARRPRRSGALDERGTDMLQAEEQQALARENEVQEQEQEMHQQEQGLIDMERSYAKRVRW